MFRKEIGKTTTRCGNSRPDRGHTPAFFHHTVRRRPAASGFWAFTRS
jgi:hypothetical protein